MATANLQCENSSMLICIQWRVSCRSSRLNTTILCWLQHSSWFLLYCWWTLSPSFWTVCTSADRIAKVRLFGAEIHYCCCINNWLPVPMSLHLVNVTCVFYFNLWYFVNLCQKLVDNLICFFLDPEKVTNFYKRCFLTSCYGASCCWYQIFETLRLC